MVKAGVCRETEALSIRQGDACLQPRQQVFDVRGAGIIDQRGIQARNSKDLLIRTGQVFVAAGFVS